jgi:flagellar biosynthesis/type III secretory pathway protein FliH
MTTTSTVPFPAPIIGLRLHAVQGKGGVPLAPRGKQLFDLEQHQARRAEATAALTQLVRTANDTVAALPEQVGQRLDEVAAIAVELGLALAREIVGDALGRGLIDPTPTVVRCLRDCVHGSQRADLVVRLHPEDLASVQTALAAMPELQEEVAGARFVADAGVGRGAVRAETGAGRLLWQPLEMLERICAEVRREAAS